MARGEMVRYMAQNQLTSPEDVESFALLDFRFAPEHSNTENFTFLR